MKHLHQRLFIASLLASAGLAMAQAPQAPQPAPGAPAAQAGPGPMAGRMGEPMGRGDPARMQQRMAEHHARHMAELKAQLKLSPAQEGAWTHFASAMQPPAQLGAYRAALAEMDKLTTPERIDRLQALKAQRDAEMGKRADAAKAFYATLTAEQQKTFDSETLRHWRRGLRGERHHRGGHGMGHAYR